MPIDRVSAKSFSPLCLCELSGPPSLVKIYTALTPHAIPTPILVQSELGPQISPADLITGRQALWSAALDDDPAVNNVGAIRDAERFPHVVIGDEDADATVAQVKDDLLDIGD